MGLNYQSFFESSPDLYLIVRPDAPRFTIETATDEYLRKARVRREDIIGRGVFEVFPDNPDDKNARGSKDLKLSLQRVLEKKVQDSMAIYKYDIRVPESGGKFEEYYWSTTNIPILENGEVKYILHKVTDVTEIVRSQQKEIFHSELTEEFRNRIKLMEKEIMKRAQEMQNTHDQLKTSVQLREDVLAIVSHDLSNPLGTIEMSIELLKDSLRNIPCPERAEFIKVIERSTRHMKRLIGDLLNFAKIQAGTLTIEPRKVRLRKLINEAEQSVLHNAIKKRVHMKTQVNSNIDELICDHDRVLEVLSNILGNAVKFSHPGGLITICVSLRKNDFHFRIQDEGQGIPDSYLPHLFDRYWQAKETSRHGAGLGLAIARGIVLSHRGEIWAESKLGSGTTMHFTIPLNQGTAGSSDFQILMA